MYLVALFRDVGAAGRVEVDVIEGGQVVFTLRLGSDDPLEGAAAAQSVVALVDVVDDTWLVDFHAFGEVNLGGFQQAKVASSADGHATKKWKIQIHSQK